MSVTVDKDGLVISIDWGDWKPRTRNNETEDDSKKR